MKHILFAIILSFALSAPAFADPASGEAVFKKKCKGCHAFGSKKMGPDLTGISQRANADWLKSWLTDNKAVWNGNDPITENLKSRVGKKSKHKNTAKKPEDIANLVDFLMTK